MGEACTVQSLQCPEERKHGGGGQGAKTAHIDTKRMAKRKRNLPQYPQMGDCMFIVHQLQEK